MPGTDRRPVAHHSQPDRAPVATVVRPVGHSAFTTLDAGPAQRTLRSGMPGKAQWTCLVDVGGGGPGRGVGDHELELAAGRTG
jgi:hypothetical protein